MAEENGCFAFPEEIIASAEEARAIAALIASKTRLVATLVDRGARLCGQDEPTAEQVQILWPVLAKIGRPLSRQVKALNTEVLRNFVGEIDFCADCIRASSTSRFWAEGFTKIYQSVDLLYEAMQELFVKTGHGLFVVPKAVPISTADLLGAFKKATGGGTKDDWWVRYQAKVDIGLQSVTIHDLPIILTEVQFIIETLFELVALAIPDDLPAGPLLAGAPERQPDEQKD